MAVKLQDNKYLKINLNSCLIDKRGIYVTYNVYKSEEDRLKEKQLEDEFKLFTNNCEKYIEEQYIPIFQKVEELCQKQNLTISSEEDFKSILNDEEYNTYTHVKSVSNDLGLIVTHSEVNDKSVEKQLKNMTLLKKFGYKSEFLTRKKIMCTMGQYSGVHTSQKIRYDDMYKELKKIYKKEGCKDC